MKLTTKQTNNIAILELNGRYDAYTAPLVEEWLTHADKHVVIDMAYVNFIDNEALKSLSKSADHLQSQQGYLHICNLSQTVQIIMELTSFDQVFAIYPTQTKAVEEIVYALVA